jgi:hypothetical protein
LFLFLRTPAKSAVEGPQGVRRPDSEFHLRTLRRDSDCIFTDTRVVQGVRRPSEVLDFTNPGGRLRDYCCKECTGSKTQITRGYLKVFRKECVQGSFWKLEFTSESSGGIGV